MYRARTSMEIQDFNPDFMDGKGVDPTTSAAADGFLLPDADQDLAERLANRARSRQDGPASGAAGERLGRIRVASAAHFRRFGVDAPAEQRRVRRTGAEQPDRARFWRDAAGGSSVRLDRPEICGGIREHAGQRIYRTGPETSLEVQPADRRMADRPPSGDEGQPGEVRNWNCSNMRGRPG